MISKVFFVDISVGIGVIIPAWPEWVVLSPIGLGRTGNCSIKAALRDLSRADIMLGHLDTLLSARVSTSEATKIILSALGPVLSFFVEINRAFARVLSSLLADRRHSLEKPVKTLLHHVDSAFLSHMRLGFRAGASILSSDLAGPSVVVINLNSAVWTISAPVSGWRVPAFRITFQSLGRHCRINTVTT